LAQGSIGRPTPLLSVLQVTPRRRRVAGMAMASSQPPAASAAAAVELPAGVLPRVGGPAAESLSPDRRAPTCSPSAASTEPASPWSPRTPAVAASPAFFQHHRGSPAFFHGLDASPSAGAPTPGMSPGAQIRRNAERMGIPLNLKVEGLTIPVPVATSSGGAPGDVLAPSPHAGWTGPLFLPAPPPASDPAGKQPLAASPSSHEAVRAAPRPSARRKACGGA